MYEQKSGAIKYYFDEWSLNANIGTFSWLLQRLTGIVLTLYLFMHILAVSSGLWGSEIFNIWLKNLQTPLTHFLEIFLLAAVAIHMLNGLRVTVADFFFATKQHKLMFWLATVIFALFMVATLIVLLPLVFRH
jgi:succinate dehydrogenase / fumarate reductase, cytochrome b subunit